MAPERIWKWGTCPERKWGGGTLCRENFFWSCPPLFGSKNTISRMVSAFVMVSTVWSVSCLLFSYLRCPRYPAVCKSVGGARAPPRAPWSRRHCIRTRGLLLLTECSVQFGDVHYTMSQKTPLFIFRINRRKMNQQVVQQRVNKRRTTLSFHACAKICFPIAHPS